MNLKRELFNVKSFFRMLKTGKIEIALFSVVDTIFRRLRLSRLFKYSNQKRYDLCKNYIKKNYNNIILNYSNREYNDANIEPNCSIWVFWAQGKDDFPYPVNVCVDRIIKKSGKHPVHVLDMYNYKQYVTIPSYVEEKFKTGVISFAHFADILRLALLKEHGGIWIDSTFFLTKEIPDGICDYAFYSINQGGAREWIVTKDKWSIGFLAANRSNTVINYWYDVMTEYWRKEDVAISYLFSDCILAIAYEDIIGIKNIIDKIPVNNVDAFIFTTEFSDIGYKSEIFDGLISNNYLFQLTYKKKYCVKKNENITNFGKLISLE